MTLYAQRHVEENTARGQQQCVKRRMPLTNALLPGQRGGICEILRVLYHFLVKKRDVISLNEATSLS